MILRMLPFCFVILIGQIAHGWGGVGHDTICRAAAHTVESEKLRTYLQLHANILGFLCNVPDVHWKNIKGTPNNGSPAHYFDSDLLGLTPQQVPLNYRDLENQFSGKKISSEKGAISSVAKEVGSLWWRIDQFQRRNLDFLQKIKTFTPPILLPEMRNESNPYVSAVNTWFESAGIGGHFVGDLSQPFHSTSDHDGYEIGHGGIHLYYEEEIISHFDETLISEVVHAAKKLKHQKKEAFLTASSTLERAKALATLSLKDLPAVVAADKLSKESIQREEKGMKIQTKAERLPIDKTMKDFKPLVIRHMSRSAAMLAQLWDDAYKASGEPILENARSYWFPFQPDFVPLDYLSESIDSSNPKK